MIRDILLAHDFSPSSERALSYAATLATRTEAMLHLLHVKEVPMGPLVKGDPSPVADEKKVREELRTQLKEHCQATLNTLALDEDHVRYHAERGGAVAPSLVRFAERTEVDLIAMGTQGHRGLQRAFVGSVAQEVLRTAPCPVLTTRDLTDDEVDPGETSVERIVAPIDFSDSSREALRYANQLASVYDVPVKLVHVQRFPRCTRWSLRRYRRRK